MKRRKETSFSRECQLRLSRCKVLNDFLISFSDTVNILVGRDENRRKRKSSDGQSRRDQIKATRSSYSIGREMGPWGNPKRKIYSKSCRRTEQKFRGGAYPNDLGVEENLFWQGCGQVQKYEFVTGSQYSSPSIITHSSFHEFPLSQTNLS